MNESLKAALAAKPAASTPAEQVPEAETGGTSNPVSGLSMQR
jgi:hypothetical protein